MFHILDFRPAYRRDLTLFSACRNHPRTLGQAPLATGRNKRNKRTCGVCVTLLYVGIYTQVRVSKRATASTRKSVGGNPENPESATENVLGNNKSPISVTRSCLVCLSTRLFFRQIVSPAIFISCIPISTFLRIRSNLLKQNVIGSLFHQSFRLNHAEIALNILDRTAAFSPSIVFQSFIYTRFIFSPHW